MIKDFKRLNQGKISTSRDQVTRLYTIAGMLGDEKVIFTNVSIRKNIGATWGRRD